MADSIILAIAELATRTGATVSVYAQPWDEDPAVIQWTVYAGMPPPTLKGSSTRIEDALAQCKAAVDAALGETQYQKAQEG